MIGLLISLAAATLVTEDLACIAAGVLVAQGRVSFAGAAIACLVGIFLGDLLLMLGGRTLGRRMLGHWPFAGKLTEAQITRASEWLSKRGAKAVLLSRFTPGLRLPVYFAAGLLRTDFVRFSVHLLIAAALWTPLLVGLSATVGDRILIAAHGNALLAAAVVLLAFVALRWLRLAGFIRRISRWEFWPLWAAYLPLTPYLLWLSIKHRSLTVFMAANPGIWRGGFSGESKSEILRRLRPSGAVPRFAVCRNAADALGFVREYPVVLKPDVGERGRGVSICRSEADVTRYFHGTRSDIIIQDYVDGAEFGVFYYRYPHEPRGRIYSITEKRFPHVTGDGRSTLGELVLNDRRAACIAKTYLTGRAHRVPEPGERVKLVEIGSHCRGAIFLDGRAHITPALEAEIERISRFHEGFYFGRFDLRAPSVEHLRAGRDLSIIELNGVTSEPTHIYDPKVSIIDAYRSLAWQWRTAFAIGAENARRLSLQRQLIAVQQNHTR